MYQVKYSGADGVENLNEWMAGPTEELPALDLIGSADESIMEFHLKYPDKPGPYEKVVADLGLPNALTPVVVPPASADPVETPKKKGRKKRRH